MVRNALATTAEYRGQSTECGVQRAANGLSPCHLLCDLSCCLDQLTGTLLTRDAVRIH
jgi:hypothetical protein